MIREHRQMSKEVRTAMKNLQNVIDSDWTVTITKWTTKISNSTEIKWEVVTVGRNIKYPDRRNARINIVRSEPKPVGSRYLDGDYEIEVVSVKEVF
jgi:hypothetical protein